MKPTDSRFGLRARCWVLRRPSCLNYLGGERESVVEGGEGYYHGPPIHHLLSVWAGLGIHTTDARRTAPVGVIERARALPPPPRHGESISPLVLESHSLTRSASLLVTKRSTSVHPMSWPSPNQHLPKLQRIGAPDHTVNRPDALRSCCTRPRRSDGEVWSSQSWQKRGREGRADGYGCGGAGAGGAVSQNSSCLSGLRAHGLLLARLPGACAPKHGSRSSSTIDNNNTAALCLSLYFCLICLGLSTLVM
jgi:hypothetical protein